MANVGYRSKKRGNFVVLMLTRMLLYWRVLEKKSTDLLVLDADVAILKYPFDTMSGEFDVMSSWGGGHAIDSRNVTLNHCSSQTDMHRIELKINNPPLVRCVSLGPPLYFKASLSYILEFVVMKYMIKPENVQKDFVDVVMDIFDFERNFSQIASFNEVEYIGKGKYSCAHINDSLPTLKYRVLPQNILLSKC